MKWFIKVITQHYADFSGRARRKEYWMYTLFYLIFSFVAGFLDGIFTTNFISPLYILALFIPNLAVAVEDCMILEEVVGGFYLALSQLLEQ